MGVIRHDPAWDPDAPLRAEWEGADGGVRGVWFSAAGGARVPALVVGAESNIGAGIIFQHAATGGPEWALAEARMLARDGIVSLLITAPFARPEPHRIIADWSDPASVRAAHLQSILDARRGVEFLIRELGVQPPRVGYVGKNLGSALAGGVAMRENRIAAFVTVASIPRMSGFWANADHPEARRRRAQYGQATMDRVADLTAEFDLAAAVDADCAWLLQFGIADDWTPSALVQKQTASLSRAVVRWYPDDHDLMDAEAEADRRAFLQAQLV